MGSMKTITHDQLKDNLRKGSFKFYYKKVNGDLRQAIGTLDLNKIPSINQPKGGSLLGGQTAYYDLEVGDWRSISSSKEIWTD